MRINKIKVLIILVMCLALGWGISHLLSTNAEAVETGAGGNLVKPTASIYAYPLTTAAAKPEKTRGYTPPHRLFANVLKQEGGETCASATVIASLPYNATGYTCDNVNDYDEACPYTGSTSPDVVYSYTPGSNVTVDIDLYGSYYDTKVYVYEDACQSPYYACNDDYYPDYTSAIIGLDLYAGHTYYIVVDGYGGSCGDYIISIEAAVPCDVVCPPGAIIEDEPWCQDNWVDVWNGGCNSSPYVFDAVACGDTICGTSGTYLYYGSEYRDTDWFRLALTQTTTLTFSCVAEFPLQTILLNAGTENCADYEVLDYRTVNQCDTATITMDLQAGVFWLWVGPSVFNGVPCGKEYVVIVGCEVATTGACCNDLDPYDCQITTPEYCATLPNHTFLGLGTSCGPPNPCQPAPDNDTCQSAVQLNPPSCPNVQTVYGTTVGATIDCPGILDWYAVWYKFTLPYASNNVFIDYCPTPGEIYTVGIVLYDECPADCPNYILSTGYQWVTCASGYMNPQVWWDNLPPGTYWLPVAVWDASGSPFMDFGISVCIEEVAPCNVVCPPGAMIEDEPWCQDDWVDVWNGGCNSWPYVFDDVSCDATICGTSGTYLYYGSQYRDTDWFRVEAGDGVLTFTCVAEFPLQTILIDAGPEDCITYTILDWRQVGLCDTATISMWVPAGVYWLWVGPSAFAGWPCGLDYVAMVQCQPFGPMITVTPSSFELMLNPDSTAEENLFIGNQGGDDLNYQVTENPAVTWLEVSPTSGTVPPSETDTLLVSFDATGLAVGDYYTTIVVASNSAKQLEDTVLVPVHLKVELPPDIDVVPRLWVPVTPGCLQGEKLRVDNLGAGELRFEVQVKKNPPPDLGDVLLVDDDYSAVYPGDFTDVTFYFTDALTANGFTYDIFEVTVAGGDGPNAATMANYPAVIWSCGEGWANSQTLTANDEANLATYLNGGGNLFLSAHDYFYDRYPSAGSFSPGQFPYDYLGVTYVAQDAWMVFFPDLGHADGMAGSVAEGMAFDLWDPYTTKGYATKGQILGPDDGLYIDEIAHNGVDLFQMTYPPPTGIAACQYEGGAGFKTVFTTVDFAGLVDGASPSTKAEFMGSMMEWFLGAACPMTVAPEADTVPPGGYSYLTLTFDGTVFEDCVEETLTCYLVFTSNDPDESMVTVPVHMWSGRGDVTGNCIIDVEDVVFLLNYFFKNGPAPDPLCMGDVDRDTDVDSDDALYLISYLFAGGPPPEIPRAPKKVD